MSKRLLRLKCLLVPYWIASAVSRNNLNTIDMLSYSKLRTILSIDDMAEYLYLNQGFKINGIPLTHVDVISELTHHSSLTSVEKAELQNSVVPLSGSEDIAKSVISKLSGANPMATAFIGDEPYKFIAIDNYIFIIIGKDFISSITNDRDFEMSFIRDYLKQCYAMESISEVCHFNVFQLYIRNLAKQAI